MNSKHSSISDSFHLDFELATRWQRLLAFLIDWIIVAIVYIPIHILSGGLYKASPEFHSSWAYEYITSIVSYMIFIF